VTCEDAVRGRLIEESETGGLETTVQ